MAVKSCQRKFSLRLEGDREPPPISVFSMYLENKYRYSDRFEGKIGVNFTAKQMDNEKYRYG